MNNAFTTAGLRTFHTEVRCGTKSTATSMYSTVTKSLCNSLFQAWVGTKTCCGMPSVDHTQVSIFQMLVLVLAATSMCQQASSDVNKVVRKRGLLHYTGLAFTPATNLGYPALSIHPFPAYNTIAYRGYGLRYPFAPTLPAYYPGFPIYG